VCLSSQYQFNDDFSNTFESVDVKISPEVPKVKSLVGIENLKKLLENVQVNANDTTITPETVAPEQTTPSNDTPDLQKMIEDMQQSMEVMKNGQAIEAQLAKIIVTGKDSTGQVSAKYDGLGRPKGIAISPGVMEKGAKAVSRMTSEAVDKAYQLCIMERDDKLKCLFGTLDGNGVSDT
jgi:DNA-binding protein YbaB